LAEITAARVPPKETGGWINLLPFAEREPRVLRLTGEGPELSHLYLPAGGRNRLVAVVERDQPNAEAFLNLAEGSGPIEVDIRFSDAPGIRRFQTLLHLDLRQARQIAGRLDEP
jgi:hypothetical protein